MAKSFLFYESWLQIINEEYEGDENEQTRFALIAAIVTYGITGEKKFPCERMFLKQAYSQIDSIQDKHLRAVENGKKGGAPKGNKNNATGRNQYSKKEDKGQPSLNHPCPKNNLMLSTGQPNENENENVNENLILNKNENICSDVAFANAGDTELENTEDSWLDDEEGEWV